MAGRYTWQGIPWETLFAPDLIGDGPETPAFTDNGVPMRFAHIQYGAKRADIGARQRINGVDVDVTTLWAAAGTESYIDPSGGFPDLVEDINSGAVAPVSASLTLTISRNGTTTIAPQNGVVSNGQWARVIRTDIGDAYDVEIALVTANAKGTLTVATLGTYAALSAARTITLSSTRASGNGSEEALRTLRLRYRRIGSATVLLTRYIDLRALAQVINEG